MKMCQALARHKKSHVTLYGKRGSWLKNAFLYYGVNDTFKIKRSILGKIPLLSGATRLLFTFFHAGLIKRPNVYYGRDALGLMILCYVFKRPVFFEAHQIPARRYQKWIWNALLKSKKLKGVVVISKALAADFKNDFSFYTKPILVAHDGADIPRQAPQKIPQSKWCGRKGIMQVGYTGSLHQGRGMELIVDVARLVPEMDFHIVGGTNDEVKDWEAKGIPQNLYLHGSKPHSKIAAYLDKFDIVLAPYQPRIHIGAGEDISRWISPMKLFEYMAASKPIICSDIPVLHEIIQKGRNGLMVSSQDPTQWVDALCDLSKSQSYREALGQEGFKDIQDHYSWNIRADHVIEFIKEHQ